MEFKTEIEILKEMINDGERRGLIQTNTDLINQLQAGQNTENQYILDLSTHAKPLYNNQKLTNEVYNNININTAQGAGVDNYGDLLHVPRILAQPGTVGITINAVTPQAAPITIPAGTELIIDNISTNEKYITSEQITIPPGAVSVTGQAEALNPGFTPAISAGMVRGLKGFNNLSATNETDGTHGRNIEEDDEYRERVKKWYTVNERGSRDCLETFLTNYPEINSFKLIPCYNGVGTLKIICDTLESETANISAAVHDNCMIVTDEPPQVELPGETILDTLIINADLTPEPIPLTIDEVKKLIRNTVDVFIHGGTRRNGATYYGMAVGEDFKPAALIEFIMQEVKEVINIYLNVEEIYAVDDSNKFKINTLEVVI